MGFPVYTDVNGHNDWHVYDHVGRCGGDKLISGIEDFK